jgi:hypothetical protein
MARPIPPDDRRRGIRGSWIPNGAMITTRFMELRKRRGLMIALVAVTIATPTLFLAIRLLLHAIDPHSYGPAGGYNVFSGLMAGVLYVFGFIVAAMLGCTAGSVDLTDGMFRQLVVTGRSRLALYLARIPAGLAIIVSSVAIGFIIVCAVCVFAAPGRIDYQGASVPAGLSRSGLADWAGNHVAVVLCDFPYPAPTPSNVECGPGPATVVKGTFGQPTPVMLRAQAIQIAAQDFTGYATLFLYPSDSLMIRSGLWIELEATIGFMVGLGLGSLLGQRTIAVILMIVLEVVLTPIVSYVRIPKLIDLQRAVVGLATAHLEPRGLPVALAGHGGAPGTGQGVARLVPETTTVAVCVIVAWVVAWTALGAWRMMTRDV